MTDRNIFERLGAAKSERPASCTHTIWPLCRCTPAPTKKPVHRNKIATMVYLRPEQHEGLKELSARLDVPITRIIRAAIDRELLAANAVKP